MVDSIDREGCIPAKFVTVKDESISKPILETPRLPDTLNKSALLGSVSYTHLK